MFQTSDFIPTPTTLSPLSNYKELPKNNHQDNQAKKESSKALVVPTNSTSKCSSASKKPRKPLNIKEIRKADYKEIPLAYYILPTFFSHRLEADWLLYDRPVLSENGETKGFLSNFNACKRIISVSFDQHTRMATARVENNENMPITPSELMIQRLDSQGDANAHRLALKVKKMADFFAYNKKVGLIENKIQRGDSFYKDYQLSLKDFFKRFEKELVITSQFKFCKESNDFEVTEIGFNETFFQRLEFAEFAEFGKSILKEGFPDAVCINDNYHSWWSKMVNNSFLRLADPRQKKENIEVLF